MSPGTVRAMGAMGAMGARDRTRGREGLFRLAELQTKHAALGRHETDGNPGAEQQEREHRGQGTGATQSVGTQETHGAATMPYSGA